MICFILFHFWRVRCHDVERANGICETRTLTYYLKQWEKWNEWADFMRTTDFCNSIFNLFVVDFYSLAYLPLHQYIYLQSQKALSVSRTHTHTHAYVGAWACTSKNNWTTTPTMQNEKKEGKKRWLFHLDGRRVTLPYAKSEKSCSKHKIIIRNNERESNVRSCGIELGLNWNGRKVYSPDQW